MVEHSAWLERYPDGVSQHCVPLQCAQKVCIHGLIQYKSPEHWLAFIKRLVFQFGKNCLQLSMAISYTIHPLIFWMTQLHSLTPKMWIFMYYIWHFGSTSICVIVL